MTTLPDGYFSEDSDSDFVGRSSVVSVVDSKQESVVMKSVDLHPGQKLINAVLVRKVAKVKEHLENGVDANYQPDSGGWTPLMHAASLGVSELIDLLLKHGASSNAHYQLSTPLMCVCDSTSFDDDELVKCCNLLVDSGANINVCNADRMSPLMLATNRGHLPLVARLIELGADLEACDAENWTAVFIAVNAGDTNMVQLLKDSGANLTLIDSMGRTPQDLAAVKGYHVLAEVVSNDKSAIIDEIQNSIYANVKMTKSEAIFFDLPDYKKSNYNGFVQDSVKTIIAAGMTNLVTMFVEKKIGLGQLLTYEQDDWKRVGVEMSLDRKKLTIYAKRIINTKWSQDAFIKQLGEEFSLLKLLQCFTNAIRIMHIIAATLVCCRRELSRFDGSDSEIIVSALLNSISDEVKKFGAEIRKVLALVEALDKVPPADFIGPKI